MNSIVSIMIFVSAMLIQLACAQYFPHRMPKTRLYLDSGSQNTNPFAKAYENQGYLQKFHDYGRQRHYEPVPQTPKKVNKVKTEKKEKIEFDYFEGSDDDLKSPDLDYNDALGFKNFDPFKFVSEGVEGIENFAQLGSLGDLGTLGDDHGLDYNDNYSDK